MAKWKGKEFILEEYGITSKQLNHIIKQGEITYADTDGVLMIDEESFVEYLEAVKQIHKEDNIVNRLKRAIHFAEEEKVKNADLQIGREADKCIDMIYEVSTAALSTFLKGKERQIFLGLARGKRLSTVAHEAGLSKKTTFLIYIQTIGLFKTHIPDFIQKMEAHFIELEEENKKLKKKLLKLLKASPDLSYWED